MIRRLLLDVLVEESRSALVLGPRQTGKTTLLHECEPDLVVDLARERVYLEHASDAGALESQVVARAPKTVLIDEVQRLPSILNTVQSLIDESRRRRAPLRFLLTGSSARKLRRGKANLLPGRMVTLELSPLVAAELDYQLDTERALAMGTLPEPYLEPSIRSAQRLLRSYSGTYVKEEIQAEALTRNLEGFSRFLITAAHSSGQFLDYSKLAARSKVSRTSTVRFFEMLEDTLIAHRATSYPAATTADLVKHPRYFFFDTGVLNGLLGSFELPPDRRGMLFEHLVFSQIRNAARARELECAIHGFRTRGGLAVDFVVEVGGQTWAIECKSGEIDLSSTERTFAAVRPYLPQRTQCVVATPSGAVKQRHHFRELPWQDLMRNMGL
jgi:predicted AAA+ superfamily ATPase